MQRLVVTRNTKSEGSILFIGGANFTPFVGLLLLGILSPLTKVTAAAEINWSSKQLYERSVADQIVLDDKTGTLQLAKSVQYEDDGPAAGFSYKPNVELVAGETWIKKQLEIANPKTAAATLLIGGKGNWQLLLNGRETSLTPIGKIGSYWHAYRFDPSELKAGVNEFVLRAAADSPTTGKDRPQIWIARDDEYASGAEAGRQPPNRSWKSTDGGKTWSDKELGTKNDVDGEYCVRLQLEQHASQGTLTLPVVDVGNLTEQLIGPPLSELGTVKVQVTLAIDNERPAAAIANPVEIRFRSGTTFAVQTDTWSDWKAISNTQVEIPQLNGRYLQVQVRLQTTDPLHSPQLQSVRIESQAKHSDDWTSRWKQIAADNPAVRRSPVPFRYESFDEPRLKQLREQEQLDQLVAGAKTQFEAACEIAKWSSQRLNNLGHLKDIYPEWDALKILEKHPDGTPIGGFCQQYNLVFLQACLSLGLTVRAVSVGPGIYTDRLKSGHETVELWSNDYRKWVYLDGNTGWYFKDVASGIPLSIWELRQRQLAALEGQPYPAVEMIRLTKTRYEWPELTSGFGFVEMRLIPRNNFLGQLKPLPLNQGMRGWFWPGHWVSADRTEPVGTLYHHRLVRQEDAEWTLNQAHIRLEGTAKTGEVRLHLDSETPGWKTYLVRWNDGPEEPSGSVSTRMLHPGKNRVSVVPVNTRGQRGCLTFVELTD